MLIWGKNIHRIFHNILAEFEQDISGFDKTELRNQIEVLNYMKNTLKINVVWMLLPPKPKETKHPFVKSLGRMLWSCIRFETSVHARDSPTKYPNLNENNHKKSFFNY